MKLPTINYNTQVQSLGREDVGAPRRKFQAQEAVIDAATGFAQQIYKDVSESQAKEASRATKARNKDVETLLKNTKMLNPHDNQQMNMIGAHADKDLAATLVEFEDPVTGMIPTHMVIGAIAESEKRRAKNYRGRIKTGYGKKLYDDFMEREGERFDAEIETAYESGRRDYGLMQSGQVLTDAIAEHDYEVIAREIEIVKAQGFTSFEKAQSMEDKAMSEARKVHTAEENQIIAEMEDEAVALAAGGEDEASITKAIEINERQIANSKLGLGTIPKTREEQLKFKGNLYGASLSGKVLRLFDGDGYDAALDALRVQARNIPDYLNKEEHMKQIKKAKADLDFQKEVAGKEATKADIMANPQTSDPYSKDTQDAAGEEMRILAKRFPTANYMELLDTVVKKYKTLPTEERNTIFRANNSSNPREIKENAEKLQWILKAHPEVYSTLPANKVNYLAAVGARFESGASYEDAMRAEADLKNLSPSERTQRAENVKSFTESPEFTGSVEDALNDMTGSFMGENNQFNWLWLRRYFKTPDVERAIFEDMATNFDTSVNYGRDSNTSLKIAADGIKRDWGVTEVNGEVQVMKFRPRGDMDMFHEQLRQQVGVLPMVKGHPHKKQFLDGLQIRSFAGSAADTRNGLPSIRYQVTAPEIDNNGEPTGLRMAVFGANMEEFIFSWNASEAMTIAKNRKEFVQDLELKSKEVEGLRRKEVKETFEDKLLYQKATREERVDESQVSREQAAANKEETRAADKEKRAEQRAAVKAKRLKELNRYESNEKRAEREARLSRRKMKLLEIGLKGLF